QRRLEEGGRYLGIPGNGDFGTSPDEGERADDRHSVLAQCPGNRVRYSLSLLPEATRFAVDHSATSLARARDALEGRGEHPTLPTGRRGLQARAPRLCGIATYRPQPRPVDASTVYRSALLPDARPPRS